MIEAIQSIGYESDVFLRGFFFEPNRKHQSATDRAIAKRDYRRFFPETFRR